MIDVDELFAGKTTNKELEEISENLPKSFFVRFLGDSNEGSLIYDLYFIPMFNPLNRTDILQKASVTTFGEFCMRYSKYESRFLIKLDGIPEDMYYIDLFGCISREAKMNELILNFEKDCGTSLFGYVKRDYYNRGINFLGRFARTDSDDWKFHPIFKTIPISITEIKSHYLRGEFL